MTGYGGLAAILGGVMYVLAFVAVYPLYFAEGAKDTFFGQHAPIHIIDVCVFALVFVVAFGAWM